LPKQASECRLEQCFDADQAHGATYSIGYRQAIAPLPPHLGKGLIDPTLVVQRRYAPQNSGHRPIRFEREQRAFDEVLCGKHPGNAPVSVRDQGRRFTGLTHAGQETEQGFGLGAGDRCSLDQLADGTTQASQPLGHASAP
jgi:hypothetical protein